MADSHLNAMDPPIASIANHLEQSGMDLVQKLASLGYFSSSTTTSNETKDKDNDDEIIFLSSNFSPEQGCITFAHLVQQIEDMVQSRPSSLGRISLTSLSYECAVDIHHIEQAVEAMLQKPSPSFMKVGNDILSSSYLDSLMQTLNAKLQSCSSGRILVSDVAIHVFHLPLEVTIHVILNRIQHLNGILWNHDKEITSYSYESMLRSQITGAFHAISIPTSLSTLQERYSWPSNIPIKDMGDSSSNTTTLTLSQYVAQILKESNFPGDFNASNDIYTPHIYIQQQQKAVLEFFTANGYMTESQGLSSGLTTGGQKMLQYISNLLQNEEDEEEVKLLHLSQSNTVLNPQVILSALEGILVSECWPNRSFVDLRVHLPEGFLSACEDALDVESLIKYCVKNKSEKEEEGGDNDDGDGGMVVLSKGEVLYVSPGMIQDVNEKILPPLIDEYAKTRAKEMDDAASSSATKGDDEINMHSTSTIVITTTKGKGKKGGKKGKHSKHDAGDEDELAHASAPSQSSETKSKKRPAKDKRRNKSKTSSEPSSSSSSLEPGIVQLLTVASAIAQTYPDLSEIHSNASETDIASMTYSPSWSISEDNNDDDEGPLFQLTRLIVSMPSLTKRCTKAVQAEYQNILKSKRTTTKSSSSSIRHENANLVRNTQESFEDLTCFPSACYLVQIMNKSISSLKDSIADKGNDIIVDKDDLEKTTMKLEKTLLRCASDFARRITEYCLFHNDVEEGIFTFSELDKEGNREEEEAKAQDYSLPSFCQPVDMGIVHFPVMHLSCNDTSKFKDEKHPDVLQVIREELPKEIGTAVARMWTLCGGECYQGGTKPHETADGDVFIRSGSFDGFLKHVEDSCL